MTPAHDQAVALLRPCWAAIDPDYKAKYRATIWMQFENQVRSAAYTTSLSRFLARLLTRLTGQLRDADLAAVRSVVESGADRAVLRILREEAAYCVTMVRLANDERRAAAKESR